MPAFFHTQNGGDYGTNSIRTNPQRSGAGKIKGISQPYSASAHLFWQRNPCWIAAVFRSQQTATQQRRSGHYDLCHDAFFPVWAV